MPTANYDPTKGTVAGQMTGLLNSGNSYIKNARNRGKEHAASRGLLNSSIAAGASEKAAINAAMPIAQQDANTYNQFELVTHNTDNAIRKGAYDVTANTQGAYLSSVNDLVKNAGVSINEIETAKDITQANKNAMIANTTARRDADLQFTRSLFSNMPTWDMKWFQIGQMPAAPGL